MTALATEDLGFTTRSDAVANGQVSPHYHGDLKRRISIARADGRLYAFDDLCTCDRPACPLSGGLLLGTTIMCQCHGSLFDIRTGAVLDGPATEALKVYVVQESGGSIRILL